MNRMNPDISTEFGLGCETTAQNVVLGMQMVCSELTKSEDWRSHQQRDWSTVEDDGWKVDSGQTGSSSGPHSNPSVAVRGSTNPEGENHQARHLMISEPRLEAQAAMQSKTTKEHRHTQIVAERAQNCSAWSRKIGSKK